jgi:hypothetical protein
MITRIITQVAFFYNFDNVQDCFLVPNRREVQISHIRYNLSQRR